MSRQFSFAATTLIAIACLAAIATTAASSESSARRLLVSKGCPDSSDWRGFGVDEAIAVARHVVIDGKVVHYQGRTTRLTKANYPVVQTVVIGRYANPGLARPRSLAREAKRRCANLAAGWVWAIVFHDSLSPMCCSYPVAFVARTERGFYVF
jgi:hypothetical protein